MPLRSGRVAITASAQNLATALGVTANTADDMVRWIQLQPAGANANPVMFGQGDLTSTVFGFSLPAGSGGVPPAPYVAPELSGTGASRLSEWHFLGTASQWLHVTWNPAT
jgi:hypothetical protein